MIPRMSTNEFGLETEYFLKYLIITIQRKIIIIGNHHLWSNGHVHIFHRIIMSLPGVPINAFAIVQLVIGATQIETI